MAQPELMNQLRAVLALLALACFACSSPDAQSATPPPCSNPGSSAVCCDGADSSLGLCFTRCSTSCDGGAEVCCGQAIIKNGQPPPANAYSPECVVASAAPAVCR